MPVTPTYPGVYIEEVSSGVRTITGVPTAIAAFIGRAYRGPVDEPVRVQNWGDFERTFGGLRIGYPLGNAVYDFFRNGGGEALVVRMFTARSEADLPSIRTAANAVAVAATGADADAAATAAEDAAALIIHRAGPNGRRCGGWHCPRKSERGWGHSPRRTGDGAGGRRPIVGGDGGAAPGR
jgi:phage tail sheath protein FI